jgi:hypothetical protein
MLPSLTLTSLLILGDFRDTIVEPNSDTNNNKNKETRSEDDPNPDDIIKENGQI